MGHIIMFNFIIFKFASLEAGAIMKVIKHSWGYGDDI